MQMTKEINLLKAVLAEVGKKQCMAGRTIGCKSYDRIEVVYEHLSA